VEFVITDSNQDSAQAGLPAPASGACRVPDAGAVEAEFAGVDGTLVQRRWVEAARDAQRTARRAGPATGAR